MNFDLYTKSLSKTSLSAVKHKILSQLWSTGKSFPRGWVKSSKLLELTKQKYFDRRVRELRDELGCDIETGMAAGEHAYRLVSTRLRVANPRSYLSESKKKLLFEQADYMCAVCGGKFAGGVRGLQADHKVPLKRGGRDNDSNWQPLCVECNVGKRRTCTGCELDCKQCPWAFPEIVGKRVLLTLPADLERAALEEAHRSGNPITQVLLDAIRSNVCREPR